MDRFNQWLTLMTNLGVIAGLVFLGLEVRQNSSQMRTEASYTMNESINFLNSGLYSDPTLSSIVRRGEQNFSSLDDDEKYRFVAFELSRLNLAEYILDLEGEGVSDIHIKYVDYIVREFQERPGLAEFIDSFDGPYIGSEDLWRRISQ